MPAPSTLHATCGTLASSNPKPFQVRFLPRAKDRKLARLSEMTVAVFLKRKHFQNMPRQVLALGANALREIIGNLDCLRHAYQPKGAPWQRQLLTVPRPFARITICDRIKNKSGMRTACLHRTWHRNAFGSSSQNGLCGGLAAATKRTCGAEKTSRLGENPPRQFASILQSPFLSCTDGFSTAERNSRHPRPSSST